jgi:hypothetical protein
MTSWKLPSIGRAGIRLGTEMALVLAFASCASIGSPAVWADGEVRDLQTFKPIPNARVLIEDPGVPADLSNSDWTDAAGKFAVFQSLRQPGGRVPLFVVADGFKPAEFSLPVLQSNTLMVRLAPAGSALESRIEYMAVLPGDGSSADGACGDH